MKKLLVVLACLVLIAVAVVVQLNSRVAAPVSVTEQTSSKADAVFANPEFGYSFTYASDTYMIVTPKDGPFGDVVFTQSVFNTKEYTSYDVKNSATEPPPSLTIAVFRNPKQEDARSWIMNSSYSNFKLSTNGKLSTTTLGTVNWLTYQWDGLYRGDEYVTAKNGYIYVLSNTWTDSNSAIKKDLEGLIARFNFVNPTMPAQSAHGDITVSLPKPNAVIESPLQVSGSARGSWYFEASFPVVLLDANGSVIASVPAQAQGDWMTQNMVPFSATLTFAVPTSTQKQGTLVLRKDNPSGLPEKEDSISIPVTFK